MAAICEVEVPTTTPLSRFAACICAGDALKTPRRQIRVFWYNALRVQDTAGAPASQSSSTRQAQNQAPAVLETQSVKYFEECSATRCTQMYKLHMHYKSLQFQ